MKMVCAIIRPHRLQHVKKCLEDIGILGLTITEVLGVGRQKGHVERYRGSEYSLDLLSKTKIDIGVPDEQCEEVVQAIRESAFTGEVGDGRIFVYSIAEAVRIRTGEAGEDSL